MPRKHALTLLLFVLALPVTAQTTRDACSEPVNIDADFSEIDMVAGQTTLRGNVLVRQCDLAIESDEAIITMDNGQARSVAFTGNPVNVVQADSDGDALTATSDQVDYDVAAAVIVFTGNAVIQSAQGEVTGEQVRYEINNNRFVGGGDEGRIQITVDAPGVLPDSETPGN